jgi:hypothetical protein
MTVNRQERLRIQLEILLAVKERGRTDQLHGWAHGIREGRGLLGAALVMDGDGYAHVRHPETLDENIDYIKRQLGFNPAYADKVHEQARKNTAAARRAYARRQRNR